MVVVAPAVLFLVVLDGFTLLLHSIPLCYVDESLSPRGFDYASGSADLLIHPVAPYVQPRLFAE